MRYFLPMHSVYLREAIAIAIAEGRQKSGLTQPQLADFAELSRSYIAAVEAAKVGISCEALFEILGVLKIPPTTFFQRIEELRAKKPVICSPGRGRKRTFSFGASDENI